MSTATKEAEAMTQKERLGELLNEADQKIERLREEVEKYRPHLPVALEVVDGFPEIQRDYKDSPLEEVGIGFMPALVNGVIVSWHDCKDLRAVKPMLREFARRGYRVKKTSDYAEIGRRSWLLVHDDDPDTTVIRVQAFVPYGDDAGAACRVVETEEMRPVKKIVCPDDER